MESTELLEEIALALKKARADSKDFPFHRILIHDKPFDVYTNFRMPVLDLTLKSGQRFLLAAWEYSELEGKEWNP